RGADVGARRHPGPPVDDGPEPHRGSRGLPRRGGGRAARGDAAALALIPRVDTPHSPGEHGAPPGPARAGRRSGRTTATRAQRTSTRSTTKISVSFGPMAPGAPRSP